MQIGELEVYSDDVVMLQIASNDPMAYAAVRINGGDEKILPYTGAFREGQELTIEPVILNEADYGFFSWSGDVSSDEETISLTMDSDHSLVLNQAPAISENLALHAAVNAKNTIESLPDWSTSNLTDGVLLTPGRRQRFPRGIQARQPPIPMSPQTRIGLKWIWGKTPSLTACTCIHAPTILRPMEAHVPSQRISPSPCARMGRIHTTASSALTTDVVAPEYYRPAIYGPLMKCKMPGISASR